MEGRPAGVAGDAYLDHRLAAEWLEWAVWPADPARSPLRSLQQIRSPRPALVSAALVSVQRTGA